MVPHYAEEFALANKPIILYEQPYNLSVANEFIYRASNWIEVKKHIDYLEQASRLKETTGSARVLWMALLIMHKMRITGKFNSDSVLRRS